MAKFTTYYSGFEYRCSSATLVRVGHSWVVKMHRKKASVAISEGYFISQRSYRSLVQARDHLRFLAQLADPLDGAPDLIYLSAEALAQCFDRLADDLELVVQDGRSS